VVASTGSNGDGASGRADIEPPAQTLIQFTSRKNPAATGSAFTLSV